jgi:ADP-ribose pyrophosphatase YjhB (NUDIX family)
MPNFCPNCGHQNWNEVTEFFKVCNNCEFESYINPRVSVTILPYNTDKEVLLVKRAREPNKNKWQGCGGFVNPLETLEEAATREFQEETRFNLESKKLEYLHSTFGRYEYKHSNYYMTVSVFSYLFEDHNQSFTPDDDISEIRWFKIADILWSEIAFPEVIDSLKLLISKKL